ncbi:PrsW family intramembrane metalloprotease [Gephyromycinifex aptenodytis]|uniref:PrsW family intramembrane metalloprotease n=1 Tax=Gephyromycinifex aptenodytis TaxID=2716227 RepID=UPI001D01A5EE|nr:PrsW family intramembrane metalloprotease [Gephyromycinifex aptenodytis]
MTLAPSAPVARNATHRPFLRRWLITAGLFILLCLGAALLTGAIGMEVGVQAGLFAAIIAVLPVGIVVPAFLWLDRYEAEPTSSLLLAFGWGALVSTSVSLVLNTSSLAVLSQLIYDPEIAATVAVAPVVEELAKGFGVLVVFWVRRREFDGVIDGIVYAGLVAAGFAFAENILYLGRALTDGGAAGLAITFVLRGLLGPFAHPLFTMWTGVGIGVMVSRGRGLLRFFAPLLGLLTAMGLHALWNGSAVLGLQGWVTAYLLVQVPIFVATIGFAVWVRRRESVLIARHLGQYVQLGLFTSSEVNMLASLPWRRAARQAAARTHGRAGKSAMMELQDCAVELAFLRHRLDRGSARPEAVADERRLVEAILRCREILT